MTRTSRRPARLRVVPLERRDVPATFTVTTIGDSSVAGSGTLRAAILAANAAAGADTINFGVTAFGSPKTITLTAALPTITDSVSVLGTATGSASPTVSGASLYRVFTANGAGTLAVTLQNLGVADGLDTAGSGAGLLNADEFVTLASVTFTNNKASTGGGAFAQTDAGSALVTGCTFTGNKATSSLGVGGAIRIDKGAASLSATTVSANAAVGYGGGIAVGAATLAVDGGSLIGGNTASLGGGGLYAQANGLIAVANSAVANNQAPGSTSDGGGIGSHGSFTLGLTNVTLSGNVAGRRGGGVYFYTGGSLAAIDSTFANNGAGGDSTDALRGGGAIADYQAALTLRNCTLTGNAAGGGKGGGVSLYSAVTAPTVSVISSVLAGNAATGGGVDFYRGNASVGTVGIDSSVVGVADDFAFTTGGGNATGTAAAPLNAKLGPLASNGGPTQTVALLAGSPAIDRGSNPASVTFDQRGTPFVRVAGAAADAGAYELTSTIPAAALLPVSDVVVGSPLTSYSFQVFYVDDTALKANTLQGNTAAVTVTGPGGAVTVSSAVIDTNTNGTPRTVTYTLAVPGGQWSGTNSGTYTIALAAGQVSDTGGTAAPGRVLGTFRVTLPGTRTVTNLNDSGPGSLRQAILDTNAISPTADTIAFQAGLKGTVALQTALPTVTDAVTISGAGATVTVDGGDAVRILTLDGPGTLAVGIANLRFARGAAADGDGGAILNLGENLTLSGVTVALSSAFNLGGGLASEATDAVPTVTVTNCQFEANRAPAGGAAVFIGAQAVTIAGSTFRLNAAVGDGATGGAIGADVGPTITVTRCSFSDNASDGQGGAISTYGGSLSLTNATLANNRGGLGGADATTPVGGALYTSGGTVALLHVTLAGNKAVNGTGGGFAFDDSAGTVTATVTVAASVVAGNTAAGTAPDIVRATTNAASTLTINTSVLGVGTGLTFAGSGNLFGTAATPVNAKLSPLSLFGGPAALYPLAGSPAVDLVPAGSATVDQNGNARPFNGKNDAGASERVGLRPYGVLQPLAPVALGAATYGFAVTYADETAIAAATANGATGAVTVFGLNGTTLTVQSAVIDTNSNGVSRTVTYTVAAPGGTWDAADIGLYTIQLNGVVQNTAGTAVAGGALGLLRVRVPVVYTVTTLTDGGPGSLRQAILDSDANATAADTIAFQAGLTGTISLGTNLPTITDSVTINGTGATVTVDGSLAYKMLRVTDGDASRVLAVAVSGLTLTRAGGDVGPALYVDGESVTLTNTTIQNGVATGSGGAVYTTGAATVRFDGATVAGNQATNNASGGGLFAAAPLVLSVTRSTFSNNAAGASGGAIFAAAAATVTVDASTFSGNTAGGAGLGGAVCLFDTGTLGVTNSTFANNAAGSQGGAVALYAVTATVTNGTFAGNTAATNGGGVALVNASSLTLNAAVVAGNKAGGTGVDVYDTGATAGTVSVTRSVVGVATDFTFTSGGGNATGTVAGPLNAKLGALANNGGPTQTLAVLAGSPAINLGATTSALTTDQRGAGYARVVGGNADAGAYELQSVPGSPTAGGTFGNVTTRNGTSYTFTVTLSDDVAVNAGTVQGADFTVTGPNGYSQTATLVSLSPNSNGTPLTATLSVAAPGGTFDVGDNGTYTVSLTGSVADTSGNPAATGSLGTFAVQAPIGVQSVVTKLADGTTTSLTAAGQRSVIPNVVITYDGLAAGANLTSSYLLQLDTATPSTVAFTVSTTTVNGKTVATLTPASKLVNGYFTLKVSGTAVTTANLSPLVVGLDGDNNGTAGGTYSLDFHHFLGDVTGDTAVDGDDLAQFAAAFNAVVGDSNYRAYLDFDGDGAIDGNDLAVFAQSFALGVL